MKISVLLPLLAFLISFPGSCEVRSSVYSIDDGIIEWAPKDFAGFYYDIDNNIGTEALRLNISDSLVEEGDAEYISRLQKAAFAHEGWGKYNVLCFLGQKYFAGYDNESPIASSWMRADDAYPLGRILLDSNKRITITDEEDIPLEEGYRVKLEDAEEGIKASLYKDKALVDITTLMPPGDYVHTADLGDANVTLIALHVSGNVKLKPQSYYTVDGIFQISEDISYIEVGSEYGLMEAKAVSSDGLVMANEDEIYLRANSNIELLDRIHLNIDGDKTLRCHLATEDVNESSYEIRSTIAEGDYTWIPQEFAGFYYNSREDLGSEMLTTTIRNNILSGEAPYGLLYETDAQRTSFEFADWGDYYLLGFLGKAYFAGYAEGSGLGDNGALWTISEEPNLLDDEQLARILLNTKKPQIIKSGDALSLKEGLEAKLTVDKSCSKVFIELYQDGNLTDQDYFDLPHTYIYTSDLGDSRDTAILALHFSDLNCSSERTCTVDGIFQISSKPLEIKKDTKYGIMTLSNINPDSMGVVLVNEDNNIILGRNKDIPIMGDFHIKTADSNILKYYVYKKAVINKGAS